MAQPQPASVSGPSRGGGFPPGFPDGMDLSGLLPGYQKRQWRTDNKYRILSLDGGGVRGLFTMHVLKRLHDETGFLDNIDCFAGTSAGSQNAMALAAGVAPKDALELAYWGAKNALHQTYGRWVQNGYTAATYDMTILTQMLRRVFATERLPALNPDVIVVAFDLHRDEAAAPAESSWRPKVFDKSDDREIVDVLLASSAAPTYFPSYQGFIDGGVVATNPSMAAVAYALDKPRRAQRDASRAQSGAARLALEDIQLLSIGTGGQATFIPGDVDWGVIDWMRSQRLIDVIFDANLLFVDFQCRQILSETGYHRVTTAYDHMVRLDSSAEAELAYLIKCANEVDLTAAKAWLFANGWCEPRAAPSPAPSVEQDASALADGVSSLDVSSDASAVKAAVTAAVASTPAAAAPASARASNPASSGATASTDPAVTGAAPQEGHAVADAEPREGTAGPVSTGARDGANDGDSAAGPASGPEPQESNAGTASEASPSSSLDSSLGDSGFIVVPRDRSVDNVATMAASPPTDAPPAELAADPPSPRTEPGATAASEALLVPPPHGN
eukprot:TRINITY_DN2444_c0_g1_i1.p1 TRINITY_DN2444_c0_g1~~TRINITY_DN2444_c0_g1_i1.p1  ORF type:complete len:559 (+),score=151.69 TRINITY_DN2444_c0_g1_i1:145-1821(+)